MKIRNGFVSNSSSSSFILIAPKDKIPLSKIEEYVGGYTDKLTDYEKDMMNFTLWRSQYMKSNDYFDDMRTTNDEIVGETEVHKECLADWKQREQIWCHCNVREDERCKSCKYYRALIRPKRADDYYDVVDGYYYNNDKELADKIKDGSQIYYITINDNEPPKYLDFDTAYKFAGNADEIFKSTDKVIPINEH